MNDYGKQISENSCPVTYCLSVIGGKWKPVILFLISQDINRFGQLQRQIDGISKQMLTKHLRELEEDGVLHRKVFDEVPPRVEYTLSERGKSLWPVIKAMRDWGNQQLAKQ
ncbi:winged helix-turn-helix transcriptional regulator [Leptothoe kymatousa]|uniref:Helix-turn-helix transcriptional regulator n=1 Tax=Leptothoe kymatousa TAU-MAC 1615 TaxID=2364775 RepID=A0ABS5Y447_9CYAN|nr:helix-turn-helix domain-containing protein [Leptothoe kymatousa]MBT9312597.1 helix-turn-helix transcriptional regulator [Leptothoe kymatousa TAU-MAC 1615]